MGGYRRSVTTLASDVWSSTQLKPRLVGTVYPHIRKLARYGC
jgi:hypothetical protein